MYVVKRALISDSAYIMSDIYIIRVIIGTSDRIL